MDARTVVAFDLRNFSTHRYHLGRRDRNGSSLLTGLIENLLKRAVDLLDKSEDHCLNYTGDGFVLLVCGEEHKRKALVWTSKFGEEATRLVAAYNEKWMGSFPDLKADLKPLDFGIGAHVGFVKRFMFTTFGDVKIKAFLGSAVNIASRVEQCTKDHVFNVICTKDLWDEVKSLAQEQKVDIKKIGESLGKHRLRGIPTPHQLYGVDLRFLRNMSEAAK